MTTGATRESNRAAPVLVDGDLMSDLTDGNHCDVAEF